MVEDMQNLDPANTQSYFEELASMDQEEFEAME